MAFGRRRCAEASWMDSLSYKDFFAFSEEKSTFVLQKRSTVSTIFAVDLGLIYDKHFIITALQWL